MELRSSSTSFSLTYFECLPKSWPFPFKIPDEKSTKSMQSSNYPTTTILRKRICEHVCSFENDHYFNINHY